jgi:molybdate transport system substrate-binding protein
VKRLVALVVLFAATAGGAAAQPRVSGITVYAAASLTDVFPRIDPGPRYSFAGSDTLAAQIEQGAPADVFASANTTLPAKLYAKHLVEKPVVFAHNRLVLVVPRSNPAHIADVRGLTKPGVKLVVADPSVPVGTYTLKVLRRLHLTSVLSHVASREPDVRSVLTKVALGEADAGFVYATDAKTVAGKVKVIALPAAAQPKVAYALAIVSASTHAAAARRFVAEVLSRAGQKKLLAAGFLPEP